MRDIPGQNQTDNDSETTKSSHLPFQLQANGNIRVGAILSQRHTIYFLLNDLTYLMAHGRISFQTEELQVKNKIKNQLINIKI